MGMLIAPCLMRNPNTGYVVKSAMHFNGSSSLLSKANATPDNGNLFTDSFWFKNYGLHGYSDIIACNDIYSHVLLNPAPDNTMYLQVQASSTPGTAQAKVTGQSFRDPAAWTHFFWVVDGSQPNSQQIRLWINGAEVTDFSTFDTSGASSVAGTIYFWLDGYTSYIGGKNYYFDGLLTEYHHLDGISGSVNDFGELVNGVWVPKRYQGSYGSGGFYLDGTSANDQSGNDNHWYYTLADNVAIPGSEGVTISSAGFANPDRVFADDGNSWAGNQCGSTDASTNPYVGKQYVGGKVVDGWGANGSAEYGFDFQSASSSPSMTFKLYGRFTAGSWVELDSVTFNDSANANFQRLNIGNTVSYDEYKQECTSGFSDWFALGEADFFEYDSTNIVVVDSPTNKAVDGLGNYAALNPLHIIGGSGGATSAGNLEFNATAEAWHQRPSTMPTDKAGLWYWEERLKSGTSPGNRYHGFGDAEHLDALTTVNYVGTVTAGKGYSWYSSWGTSTQAINVKGVYNNSPGYGEGTSGGVGVWMACALDLDNGFFYLGKISGGTISWVNGGDPASGALGIGAMFAVDTDTEYFVVENINNTAQTGEVNFGARGWNAVTPPSGYKALHTANKAKSATKTSEHAAVVLWSGTGANQNLDLDFTPDFVWAKRRDAASQHVVYDVLRGENNEINTDLTNSERTNDYGLDFLGHNGLEVEGSKYFGGSGLAQYDFWALCLKAGGVGVANSDGSITCTVSANTVSGFSLVKGAQGGANFTFGHGLGVAPELVIYKPTSYPSSWSVWHKDLSTGGYFLYLDTTVSETNGGSNGFIHSATPPDSSVVYMGSGLTDTSVQFVAYCFAGIDVLDTSIFKIGSFTASGSNSGSVVDGDFVYMDGTPLWKLQKSAGLTQSWAMQNSVMDDGDNPISSMLSPDTSGGENFPYGAGAEVNDFVSNGYKRRRDWGPFGYSGNKQIYLAILADRVAQNNRGR